MPATAGARQPAMRPGTRLRDYGRLRRSREPGDRAARRMRPALGEASCRDRDRDERGAFSPRPAFSRDAEAAPILARPAPPQRVIRSPTASPSQSDDFRFAERLSRARGDPKAGTVIARDGGRDIRTPYDDCVLIMPSRRLARGQTAVRLGTVRGVANPPPGNAHALPTSPSRGEVKRIFPSPLKGEG